MSRIVGVIAVRRDERRATIGWIHRIYRRIALLRGLWLLDRRRMWWDRRRRDRFIRSRRRLVERRIRKTWTGLPAESGRSISSAAGPSVLRVPIPLRLGRVQRLHRSRRASRITRAGVIVRKTRYDAAAPTRSKTRRTRARARAYASRVFTPTIALLLFEPHKNARPRLVVCRLALRDRHPLLFPF